MGSLFDLCASRKLDNPDVLYVDTPSDLAFLRKYPNATATNVTLPSGQKVPSRQWTKDWVIKGDKIVLQRRTSEEQMEASCLLLIAPNDVGYAKCSQGKVCSGLTLPSGFKVPEKKMGREWIFDGEAVVLRRS